MLIIVSHGIIIIHGHIFDIENIILINLSSECGETHIGMRILLNLYIIILLCIYKWQFRKYYVSVAVAKSLPFNYNKTSDLHRSLKIIKLSLLNLAVTIVTVRLQKYSAFERWEISSLCVSLQSRWFAVPLPWINNSLVSRYLYNMYHITFLFRKDFPAT